MLDWDTGIRRYEQQFDAASQHKRQVGAVVMALLMTCMIHLPVFWMLDPQLPWVWIVWLHAIVCAAALMGMMKQIARLGIPRMLVCWWLFHLVHGIFVFATAIAVLRSLDPFSDLPSNRSSLTVWCILQMNFALVLLGLAVGTLVRFGHLMPCWRDHLRPYMPCLTPLPPPASLVANETNDDDDGGDDQVIPFPGQHAQDDGDEEQQQLLLMP